MTDTLNPSYYKDRWSNGAELIDVTSRLNFCRGNAVKYIARAGVKNPETYLEDLEKAKWYLTREIERTKFRGKKTSASTTESSISPDYYNKGWANGTRLIDIVENLNFCRGNAVKYIARAGAKNPDTEIEDLEKALWFVNREISDLQSRG